MLTVEFFSSDGSGGKPVELPGFFERPVNEHLLYEAVKCYLANQRQGTSKTKTRAEVSGGGAKPFKQKGTGRARAGSNTSPVWVRGGKAHGAKPRKYSTYLNKKARRNALAMALSTKASEKSIKVIEGIEIDEPKTKKIVAFLEKIGAANGKKLLVLGKAEGLQARLAGRNIPELVIRPASELNAYDVLQSNCMIMTKRSLNQFGEIFGK